MQKAYVVYDRNVEDFARTRVPALGEFELCGWFPFLASEDNKTLSCVGQICSFLLAGGADRDSLLIAVGGGITTDVCGLVAGIYKRGIRIWNVPTTLLAQVDAAIGGKNGVNLNSVKNALGLIRLPDKVCCLPEPLQSLPAREFRNGLAEMLKTFIIFDKDAYGDAVAVFSKLQQCAYSSDSRSEYTDKAYQLGRLAAGYKERVVSEDLHDHGQRHLLNLGHTIGHAIEWHQSREAASTTQRYSHGEAVAIGIVAAARIASYLNLAPAEFPCRLAADFTLCGLPSELPCSVEKLLPAITEDKKIEGERLDFVLPEGLGKAERRKFTMEEFAKTVKKAL